MLYSQPSQYTAHLIHYNYSFLHPKIPTAFGQWLLLGHWGLLYRHGHRTWLPEDKVNVVLSDWTNMTISLSWIAPSLNNVKIHSYHSWNISKRRPLHTYTSLKVNLQDPIPHSILSFLKIQLYRASSMWQLFPFEVLEQQYSLQFNKF